MSMRARALLVVPTAAAALTLTSASVAQAKNFTPKAGSYTANTTALTLTGPGTSIKGEDVKGVAVFSFKNVSIPSGATITASGSRPLEIVATGSFRLAGTIDGSGFSQTGATFFQGKPGPGGPGGGTGSASDAAPGGGPGGGKPASNTFSGGGGGGFGGNGATGGSDSGTGGPGGLAYGNLATKLQGGSGGAGGTDPADGPTGGGGGGGAIELSAAALTISTSGSLRANGGDGGVGDLGASGGGSGGGILLHAGKLDVAGKVSANGGQGGAGECCADGGGGGGGRILYEYGKLVAAGAPTVTGGTSGTNGAGPSLTHPSPEVRGAAGVFAKLAAASAQTLSASKVTTASAKVRASINPKGHAATYRFQFGTSKKYGRTSPGKFKKAGSGKSAVHVSALLGKLKPGTTYHYRVVVHSLGLTIVGADRTFRTKAAVTPPTFTG